MRAAKGLLVVLVAISGVAVAPAAEESAAPGLSALSFPLQDLGGRVWSRLDLDGKVVLLDFWATWCTPCIAELPHMRRAYEMHRDGGFEILAVSLDRTEPAALRRWLRTRSVLWPQLHDNRGLAGDLPQAFAVDKVPRSFLFDRSGRLVAVDLRGEALEAAVAALVALPGSPGVAGASR